MIFICILIAMFGVALWILSIVCVVQACKGGKVIVGKLIFGLLGILICPLLGLVAYFVKWEVENEK